MIQIPWTLLVWRRRFHGPACVWPYKDANISKEDIKKLEAHWRDLVSKSERESSGEKKYVLSMFPYPSGNLHMGHVRVYTISDCLARFYSLLGHKVIHPMGWDAFGLPAENAAIERKQSPELWTLSNIEVMRQQLLQLGCRFDWDKEVATCHPSYYRWTQLIFLKLYEAGLAYQRASYVNWDPVDRTVLADEQIDSEGRSWRSGAVVEKRPLCQWFIRATRFTKDLVDNLDQLSHWDDIVDIQRHWLGRCDVYKFWMPLLRNDGTFKDEDVDILISDPVRLSAAAFLVIRPSHILNQPVNYSATATGDEKILSLFALNPLTGQRLPIIVSTDVAYEDEAFNVYVGVADEHSDLLKRVKLDVDSTPSSASYSAQDVIAHAKANHWGGYVTSRTLGDWVVSRQRYWGTPIPVIHCQKCKTVPVPESELPVVLPKQFPTTESTTVDGRSPLAAAAEWLRVKCPKCGSEAERETDTLDTFFDSSWYYFRYLDSTNETAPFDPRKIAKLMPVDVYVGGKEHAALHLYYARVISHFLHSLGWTSTPEPFYQLLPQGMIMGKAYQISSTGQFISKERVTTLKDESFVDSITGLAVTEKWEKMSKSKHNGVNPLELLDAYGTDVTRLLVMSASSPRSHFNWDLTGVKGMLHWMGRIWWVVSAYIKQRQAISPTNAPSDKSTKLSEQEAHLRQIYNTTTRRVSYYVRDVRLLSTAIAKLIVLTSELRKCHLDTIGQSLEFERCVHALVIMLSIFAPHFASEAWAALASVPGVSNTQSWKKDEPVWRQEWPKVDEDAELDLEIFFGGEPRGKVLVDRHLLKRLSAVEAFEMVRDSAVVLQAAKTFEKMVPKSITHVENFGARLYVNVHQKKKAQKNNVAIKSAQTNKVRSDH